MAELCGIDCTQDPKEPVTPLAESECLCIDGTVDVAVPDTINVNSTVNLDEWQGLINQLQFIAEAINNGSSGGGGQVSTWRPAVEGYEDLATTYPNPVTGWYAATLDDGKIYQYNGSEWVEIPYSEKAGKMALIYPLSPFPDPIYSITQNATNVVVNSFSADILTYHGEVLRLNGTFPTSVFAFTENQYLFVSVPANGTTAPSLGRTSDLNYILDDPNRYICGRMINVNGKHVVEIYGIGQVELTDDVTQFARMLDFTNTAPVSWQTQSNGRNLFYEAGTYTLISSDGTYAGDYVITANSYLPFVAGQYLYVDITSDSGTIITTDDFAVIAQSQYYYCIGYFNYVGGINNVYIEGFGNYPDTPASYGTGTANIEGVPSTFNISWSSNTSFTMPNGRYIVRENGTGISRTITLDAPLTLEWSFSSVLFFLPSVPNTFGVASAVALPSGAVTIGSLNYIGNVPNVFLYGLQAFPLT